MRNQASHECSLQHDTSPNSVYREHHSERPGGRKYSKGVARRSAKTRPMGGKRIRKALLLAVKGRPERAKERIRRPSLELATRRSHACSTMPSALTLVRDPEQNPILAQQKRECTSIVILLLLSNRKATCGGIFPDMGNLTRIGPVLSLLARRDCCLYANSFGS